MADDHVEEKNKVVEKETVKKEQPVKRRKRTTKTKAVVSRGKRKRAIARATIKKGKGNVWFNKQHVDAFQNDYVKNILLEPLSFVGAKAGQIDIYVNVRGGGMMGQAQAARTAIARALVDYFKDSDLEAQMLEYDRTLLIEDVRRVEPKKYKGPKARARFQKSYR